MPSTASEPAIKVLLLPKDTNALGTIFGGVRGCPVPHVVRGARPSHNDVHC